jgi:hypothetical protein
MSQDQVYQVIPLRPEHRKDWDRFYAGYAAFYKVEQTPQMRDIVWGWSFNTENPLRSNRQPHRFSVL